MTEDPLAAGDAIARANNTRIFGPSQRTSRVVALQILALDEQIAQLSWMPVSNSATRVAELEALKAERAVLQAEYGTIVNTAAAEHTADFAPMAAVVTERDALVAELQGLEAQLAQVKTMGNHPSVANRSTIEASIAALLAELEALEMPPYGAP